MLLDTPYGFQSNADDISAQARSATSRRASGARVDVVSWRTPPSDAVARERALAVAARRRLGVRRAGQPDLHAAPVARHADPGRCWPTSCTRGGVVLFASAAALTLGTHTVPVYEIYKAGAEPHWAPGLNLVEAVLGFPAVVIPHYDNAEGGHHDTRYCYLGEDAAAGAGGGAARPGR